MSVGFGFSFGDFVTGITLFIDAVKAIDDANGAPAEIRMLKIELEVLQSAMKAVENCNLQETNPYYEAAIKSAKECQRAIEDFKEKFARFLEVDKMHKSIKKAWRSVNWALIRKDDVNTLRSHIGAQTTALNLLLSAILLSRETSAGQHSDAQLSKQTEILIQIREHLDRGDAEQTQLLQKIESLVTFLVPSPPYSGPGSHFEVRPLRLIGAPVIDMDHFVDRPAVMTSIELAFSSFSDTTQKVVVLQGMGGIGKSQLARSYAYLHQHKYTAIFWLNAKTEQSLSLGVAQMAELIPLPDFLGSNRQIRKDDAGIAAASIAVTDWLSQRANTDWLLVLDNVDNQTAGDSDDIDDDQDVYDTANRNFDAAKYIPQVSHGSVLITSRLSFLSGTFGAYAVRIDQMSEDEGVRLLCKASHTDLNEAGVYKLAERLGSHPLALSQAGQYIEETHTSPLDYLEQFEKRFATLIKKRPGARGYRNGSISATLSLSYDQLKTRNPSAAALLMLCSCLDNSNISFEIFGALVRAKEASRIAHDDPPFSPCYHNIPGLSREWLSELCEDDDLYLGAISSLHQLSFVRRNERSKSVSIHPLIHEWSLHYYVPSNKGDNLGKEENLAATCNILGATVPQTEPYFEGLPIPRIQHHIDRWFSLMPKDTKLGKASIGTILAMSEYDIVRGPLERAYRLREVAYDNAQRRFLKSGSGHRCIAEAGIAIAMTHFETQQYQEAIKWYEAHRDGYSKIDWPQSGFDQKANEALANLLITSHLILCYRAAENQEAGQHASDDLYQLKEELRDRKDTVIYPIAAWLYYVLQIAVNPSADEEKSQVRLKESIKTSEHLLQTIQGASTWPPSFGSRDFAIASLCSVLGGQYIDNGDTERGQAHLQRAFEINQQLSGPSAPDTLALAREVVEAGADPSVSVFTRNKLWHTTLMGAFRTLPTSDKFGIPKDKSLFGNRPTRRNLWAFARWTDALTTVQHSVRNRPEREREENKPVVVRQAEGDTRLSDADMATKRQDDLDVKNHVERKDSSPIVVGRETGPSQLGEVDLTTSNVEDLVVDIPPTSDRAMRE